MRAVCLRFAVLLGGVLLGLAGPAGGTERTLSTEPKAVTAETPDRDCLECHGVKGFAVPKGETGEARKRHLYVEEAVLRESVHKKEPCIACHRGIDQIPHKTPTPSLPLGKGEGGGGGKVDCVHCHEQQPQPVDEVQVQETLTRTMAGLPSEAPPPHKLLREAGHYLDSIHAKPGKQDPSRPNAACWDCHGKHNVFPMSSKEAQTYRLSTPETCGNCHEKELKDYQQDVHGALVKRLGKLDAAVCTDCHTAHKVAKTETDPVKLALTENCGTCHKEAIKTYRETYHGQVTRLGYAHTAKCNDCHGAHTILKSDDPAAPTHADNRLKTCSHECHKEATAGFVSFAPHGNTHDFKRYPAMWIASKFMIVLLAGVFLFFWTHSALWFHREYQEKKSFKAMIHLDHHSEPIAKQPHVRRFSWQWRLAHLALALAVMTLVLTGTTVLYAESFWAPTVMKLLGGPKVAALIHRTAATTFGLIFFGHIAVALYQTLIMERGRFQWFGPESLLPNRQDGRDIAAMFRWFLGKGPRPVFDRWTYFEKFDYWAPFWGMFIIGCSGLMLWFPEFFGRFLPGWVFNVATLIHGEEAFLAAVFLFTVHFFNSHFRPDKFPLDVVMFTGSMTLEEFKLERPLEYARLVQAGTLEQYLVGAPSARMDRYSQILGFTLIAIGLILLCLVLLGFIQNLFS
jgi:cytochrome b subunit of formate dehydrogenase